MGGINVVFQSPRKWLKQYTREGPRLVSCTKVSTFLCVKNKNGNWNGRNVGLTFACFHCDREKGLLDLKLTKESQNGDLQDLLNSQKKVATAKGSILDDFIVAMANNMRRPDDVLARMAEEGRPWFGAI